MPMPDQLPQSVAPSAANLGPAASPQGNQGNVAMALIDVRNGVNLFQKALPMIPLGAPLHAELLDVVKKISKHLTPGGENQGLQLQSLLQLARQSASQPPVAALSRMFGAGPNAAPAMAAPPEPTPPPAQ
jgi:hypothetical protein